MKPTPADVICLCALLRGAKRLSETKKEQWWKAAATLAASPNVSADHQRDLQHLLLLREHGWDAAAASQAAQELDVRKQAEAAAAALNEARLQRQAQEEATARAAGELDRVEGQLKAAAATLAELQKDQGGSRGGGCSGQGQAAVGAGCGRGGGHPTGGERPRSQRCKEAGGRCRGRGRPRPAAGTGGGCQRCRRCTCSQQRGRGWRAGAALVLCRNWGRQGAVRAIHCC
jgi:hypothetical protein